DATRQIQVGKLVLPNSAYITNAYDSMGRLLSTVLKNSSGNSVLNSHSYGYNLGNQRTALTNTLGDYRSYGYDKIGQLKTAIGKDNLARADTNTATAYLPDVVYFAYDLNGNLLSDGQRAFDYDDENELIRVTVTNRWKSEFTYDGGMRRRIRKEYGWQFGSWN